MLIERLSGPFRGYYIAAYTTAHGRADVPFDAYFKICSHRPRSYWEAQCLLKGKGAAEGPTAQGALAAAENQARQLIAWLPAPPSLRAHHEGRPLTLFEMQQVWATSDE
jgi:hypothetical protein